ncbi:MAG: hypothetical protein KJO64_05535 [Bacteroidia bacterium]|nr:hypothetical protein [Bacteroidia bacterium]NNC85049.1 hypothetical protein [Bacteroidia bacterium]
MNILALVRTKEDLTTITDYAKKVASDGDSIHILNIVNVSGNIPTKKDTGEIIDGCTEFDVSQYYNERRDNENWLKTADLGNYNSSVQAIVGSRYTILKNQEASLNIDLVITTTTQSSDTQDFFKYTTAGIVHDKLNVPVLALKCDRSKEDINDIAIVSDFTQTDLEDLSVLKHIASKSNASFTLYAFSMDKESDFELNERMDKFVQRQDLKNTKNVIIHTQSKERSASEMLMEYPIQLMVVLDIHRVGFSKIIKGSLEKDIMNRNLIPILAY